MSTFRHPAFPTITHAVPDDLDDEAVAAGWVPVVVAKTFAWGVEKPVKVEHVDRDEVESKGK